MPGMVRVSEAAALALHTMAMMAQEIDRRFTTQEVATALKASSHHLAKVMQRLAKVGLVASTRGPKGGFTLGRPPHEVNLLQICEAVEGPVGHYECLLSEPVCTSDNCRCILGDFFQSMHNHLQQYLARTTLADLSKGFVLELPA